MHPMRAGPVDGHPATPAVAAAAGASDSTSASASVRRRPRVDSNPLLPPALAPELKRIRSVPGEGSTTNNNSTSTSAAMSKGKQPEVIDLTGPAPSVSGGIKAMPKVSAFQPHAGARKLVIKNLRVAPRAAEVEAYYQRTWVELEEALAAVFAERLPQQPLERLYRGVEDLCLHGQAMKLHGRLRALVEAYLSGPVLTQIRAETQGVSDVEVLRTVLRHWHAWTHKSTLIRSTFSYLDRTYLLNNRQQEQINDLLIKLFRRMIFDSSKERSHGSHATGQKAVAGMCELVVQDRRGEPGFDGKLLQEAVAMLHVLNMYGRYFEPVFLQTSTAYLRDFAQEHDAASAALKPYILACEALLSREDVRCNTFNLDSSTKRQLREAAQLVLVAERAPKLLDAASVTKLLDGGDVGSMKALYELLRLSRLQKQLRGPWEAYIEAAGSAVVTDVARGDEMVVRLLVLRRSLDVVIRDAFGRDEDFAHGLRAAFGRLVNDRRVTAAWGAAGPSKVGEMVAKHLDLLLRGGLKTLPLALLADSKDRAAAERRGQASTADEDAELDRQLDQGLELFRFINGKDVFEAFYKKDLARRLLMGRSASQDAERNMLSKLKTECGASLTHNLEQMFRDQELSRDEMASYKQWLEGTGRARLASLPTAATTTAHVDLHVSVLSAAAWPSYDEVPLNMPPEVLDQVQLFDSYYKAKHTGRLLTWMHALGHCVVKARFDRGTKELLVSAFQAAVLLLFNQVAGESAGEPTNKAADHKVADPPKPPTANTVLSYAQIAAATGLEGGHLDRTLQSLACGRVRVLKKHPQGRDIQPTDTFSVNRAFWDPKFRIKINQIQLKETREENNATYERVAADRQFETQAAIVRIMKSRKTMPHAQLVAEVISQTKTRGALDPADIKQNIEKLIEKDYLEREDGNYVYLA